MRTLSKIDADLTNSHQALDALIAGVRNKTLRPDRTWKVAVDGVNHRIDRLTDERDAAIAAETE